jgi:hypothetical protein
MLRPSGDDLRVYLHRPPVDMRKYALFMIMHFESLSRQ